MNKNSHMKAAVLEKYGSPSNICIQNVVIPSPEEGEVLVRIQAASVNDWDWGMTTGSPFYIRLLCGLFKPKVRIPGVDISGRVETLGRNAKRFEPGDLVYGDLSDCGFGAFAEFVCVPERRLARRPSGLDAVRAAAIPHAAALAVQGLRDEGKLQAGQSLLINGAGGGVGTLGLQIAKSMGAGQVTGVDHGAKQQMMRSLGFDEIIDYTKEDFTASGKRYDLILDAKTNRFPLRYLRALKPNGSYVTVGGKTACLLQALLAGLLVRLFSRKRIRILSLQTNQGLDFIEEWIAGGKVAPVIDGPFSLEQLPAAIQRFGKGLHKGKVIISMDENHSGAAFAKP